LAKIADALGVKVGILFEDDEAIMKAMIVPMYEKDIKAQLEANDEVFSAYSYIPLARQISRKIMDPYLITVLPGKKNTQAFVHKGEEFNYVLTGTLKFLYGDTAYTFKAGECFYIDSKISHNMEALNNEPVTMLSVNAAVINGS
jgi:quercetin dioxygenase-like cupin family protein